MWHRGDAAEAALASWRGQPESVPVLFNRGMAALFLGDAAAARAALAGGRRDCPRTGRGTTWRGCTWRWRRCAANKRL